MRKINYVYVIFFDQSIQMRIWRTILNSFFAQRLCEFSQFYGSSITRNSVGRRFFLPSHIFLLFFRVSFYFFALFVCVRMFTFTFSLFGALACRRRAETVSGYLPNCPYQTRYYATIITTISMKYELHFYENKEWKKRKRNRRKNSLILYHNAQLMRVRWNVTWGAFPFAEIVSLIFRIGNSL